MSVAYPTAQLDEARVGVACLQLHVPGAFKPPDHASKGCAEAVSSTIGSRDTLQSDFNRQHHHRVCADLGSRPTDGEDSRGVPGNLQRKAFQSPTSSAPATRERRVGVHALMIVSASRSRVLAIPSVTPVPFFTAVNLSEIAQRAIDHLSGHAAEVERDGKRYTCAKGAPNAILRLSEFDPDTIQAYHAKSQEFAQRGFRSLGVAVKEGAIGSVSFLSSQAVLLRWRAGQRLRGVGGSTDKFPREGDILLMHFVLIANSKA